MRVRRKEVSFLDTGMFFRGLAEFEHVECVSSSSRAPLDPPRQGDLIRELGPTLPRVDRERQRMAAGHGSYCV